MDGFFKLAKRKMRLSPGSHFQWLAAIDNVGTALCR